MCQPGHAGPWRRGAEGLKPIERQPNVIIVAAIRHDTIHKLVWAEYEIVVPPGGPSKTPLRRLVRKCRPEDPGYDDARLQPRCNP